SVCFFLLLSLLRSPLSTLFPYTTLFRSGLQRAAPAKSVTVAASVRTLAWSAAACASRWRSVASCCSTPRLASPCSCSARGAATRSEEHTSELQSPCNLVCRLLLEKKKKI